MRDSKEERVKRIVHSIYAAFPRSDMMNDAAMGMWAYALKDFSDEKLRKAASRWIREEKWPPDSLSKFIAAVSRREYDFTQQDSVEFQEFRREYRAEGHLRQSIPEDKTFSPKTNFNDARTHWALIRDIRTGVVAPPRSIAKHDVVAIGDAQDQWYWAEFNRRKEKKNEKTTNTLLPG